MGKPLRTKYWRKGNTFFGTMKSNRGKNVTLKFDLGDYDRENGTIKVTEKRTFRKGAEHGIRVYTKTVKATVVDGVLRLGRTVKDSSKKIKEVTYRFSGDSRIENGFDSLMSSLRMYGGASPEEVQRLYDMWDTLTPKQKREFYAEYQQSYIVTEYGSDAINESKVDFEDDRAYYTTIEKILTEIVGED